MLAETRSACRILATFCRRRPVALSMFLRFCFLRQRAFYNRLTSRPDASFGTDKDYRERRDYVLLSAPLSCRELESTRLSVKSVIRSFEVHLPKFREIMFSLGFEQSSGLTLPATHRPIPWLLCVLLDFVLMMFVFEVKKWM